MATTKYLVFIILLMATLPNLHADDFPPVKNSPSEAHLSPMPPTEAAASMKVPEGFQLKLFAAEPEVQNPIALTIDDRDRVWIAENFTYSDRTQRFDLAMRDRVLIFEDSDGDGKADRRTVFTDQVQMLTSVALGRGGVWLMCPPRLLFIPDADNDDHPDGPAQVILDGFEVAQDNYHNFANGLRWGPDGWLYGRCGHSCPGWIGTPGTAKEKRIPIDGGLWRYHPEHKQVEVLCHGTVNPWGHDWDEYGELFFVNTVIGHLWHMMPGAHMKESFGESMNSDVYERMDMIADHYHFDTRGSWSEGRDGKANDLGGGHAHIGASIYKGTRWPEQYRGRLFTVNMHGRRINSERLERHGAGYVGKHEKDLLIAEDPFFRGLDLRFDQQDNAFIIDWSDTGECHESTGVHRTSGRIYKLSYTQNTANPSSVADRASVQSSSIARLERLWSNYRANNVPHEQLLGLLYDPDEHLRVWAIRLQTDLWPLDTILGPHTGVVYPDTAPVLEKFVHLAANDKSGLVQLALASVLQRLPVDQRTELARALTSRAELANDRDLPLLVWYGIAPLGNQYPEALVSIARSCRWPLVHRFIARKLATGAQRSPEPLSALLAAAQELSVESQSQITVGLYAGLQGVRKLSAPATWKEFAKLEGAIARAEEIYKLNTLFGEGQSLDEIRAVVRNTKAEMQTRQRALETLIDARPDDLRTLCESLLDTRVLNGTAIRGLALNSDPQVGRLLARKYKRFQPEDRPAVLEILVTRPEFATELLKAMAQKNPAITPADLNAYHARAILGFHDPELSKQLAEVWGELRETPAQRRELIDALKNKLDNTTLSQANLVVGRQLFNKQCGTCHVMYGQGKQIGPDLTGSQRTNLDYLLENIIDPSAVVAKNYRMSKVLTSDGRVISGLLVSRNEQSLIIQTPTKQEVVPRTEVERIEETTLSPMPDGILETLKNDEVRDLIAYLMHPSQV